MKNRFFSLATIFCDYVCLLLLLASTVFYSPFGLAQVQDNAQPVAASRIGVVATDDSIDKNTAPAVLAAPAAVLEGVVSETMKVTENNAADITAGITSTKATATLPQDLSPWGMFMAADWVVKTVMIGLVIASLLTWTVLVSKTIELHALKRLLQHSDSKITAAYTLADAANRKDILGVGREFIEAAEAELYLSIDWVNKEGGKEGIKERVVSSLSRIEARSTRRMLVGTGLLATIGSVAPFVGLFGTVWGIMNSFISISQANTTNLAVVAPGIAEALMATALGLVAAIPAVVIYNHFSRQIAGVKTLTADSAAAVMRLVSRDMDRGVSLHVVNNQAES